MIIEKNVSAIIDCLNDQPNLLVFRQACWQAKFSNVRHAPSKRVTQPIAPVRRDLDFDARIKFCLRLKTLKHRRMPRSMQSNRVNVRQNEIPSRWGIGFVELDSLLTSPTTQLGLSTGQVLSTGYCVPSTEYFVHLTPYLSVGSTYCALSTPLL